jgi:hypothetical protein
MTQELFEVFKVMLPWAGHHGKRSQTIGGAAPHRKMTVSYYQGRVYLILQTIASAREAVEICPS